MLCLVDETIKVQSLLHDHELRYMYSCDVQFRSYTVCMYCSFVTLEKETTMIRQLIIATTALTCIAGPVLAAGPREADDLKVTADCRTDFRKLCKDTPRVKGISRMGACFTTHQSELSDGCKAALANRKSIDARERSQAITKRKQQLEDARDHRKPPVTATPPQGQPTSPTQAPAPQPPK